MAECKASFRYVSIGSLSWLRSSNPIVPKDYYFWDSAVQGLGVLVVVGYNRTQNTTTTAAEIALPAELTCCWVKAFCLRVFIIVAIELVWFVRFSRLLEGRKFVTQLFRLTLL